ncbi:Transcription factor iws1 [Penicillium subrubescens]|uniref:Transcription factor iws1 n=1 Tax=Penicillium subrubescens TaxID=1316194 RepID=A0A1Q5SZT5_9EURO|nr:Transcription factor iws1 [Penicillium subrubescens]KAJ5883674.1 Transcription factor iws1 [Penicillium subrubescens]OKO93426.1 Transcription factor iws1 [Penicillium subrubescens]
MSASPEHQAGSAAASPEPEKVATPIAADDDEAEQPADPIAEAGDNDDDDNEGGISDDESILSEVDEAQFEDFNPENVDVEDRPQLAIDEENLKLIGRHKRKRADDGEGRSRRKEGRREKKSRRAQDEDEGEDGSRRKERKKKEASPDTDEETLDPETRRRRALDRAMDEAIRKPGKRRSRKQDGIDLEAMADAEIEDMRKRMTHAAQMDAISRQEGKPAMHKLKLLPEVIMLLNRNQYINSLVDPEINLLEAVRFFLEPLDDGSMPAYNIQRDLLTALAKLPIQKDALIASGIGKVVVFYTKSKRTERRIKDMAEKLLAEWTRPILQRSDDYSKRVFQQADFDPTKIIKRTQTPAEIVAAEARAREKLPPRLANRARVDRTNVTYTIVPRQTAVQESKFARPLGSSGEDRFRKMQARNNAAQKGSRR